MKHAHNPVVLREITSFKGAEYNPRKMIPERLHQVRISLRKLGFLLPIYVNKNGTILSGHQRTTAALAEGYTKVPVVELDIPDEYEKGMNVIFNKGTNDLDTNASDAKTAFTDYIEKASNLVGDLPDIPPDTYYPCMEMQDITLADGMAMAGVEVSINLRKAGYGIVASNVFMPIITCNGKIINGKGRVHGYAAQGYDSFNRIEIAADKADYANLALNFLAMDFDIQSHFKEELRYNAFRRKGVQAQIVGLSRTYPYFVYGRIISNTALKYGLLEGKTNPDLMLLPTATEEARRKFQETYGKVIFDMGAGTLHDAKLMQEAGFDCVPFEPFYTGEGSEPNVELTRELVSHFLDRVRSVKDTGPDSMISSFVLNSVPHHEDRMAYLAILAATAKMKTNVYIGTQSVRTLNGKLDAHLRMNNDEPNVTLGNDARFFKAQKFYYLEELEKMLRVFFATVKIKEQESNLFAHCQHPRRVPASLLRESLDLEFNMPYKGGHRMNLNDKAKEVYSEYTGMSL
jgi:hypothetical protein